MKFLLKLFSYILVFLLSFLIFLPKVELFNLLEKELEKKSIIVSEEIKDDRYISLKLTNPIIYFEKIKGASIDSVDIMSLLFYSKIEVDDVLVSKDFQNFLPQKISKTTITHSILDFKNIFLKSKGDFGVFDATVDIFNGKIKGILEPSAQMKTKYRNLLREFKFKDGKYYYERSF